MSTSADVEHDNQFALDVFTLSLSQGGAIEHFQKHLPVEIMESEGKGIGELYKAAVDFYIKFGIDPIDRSAFESWLKDETLIYDAIGGEENLDTYLSKDRVPSTEMASTIVSMLKSRHNRSRQAEALVELQDLFSDTRLLGDEGNKKIDSLADSIKELNKGVSDPLASVCDGDRIASDAEELWKLPDFLPTQFPDLNTALGYDEEGGGFVRESVNAILAASGLGKSTFAKTLMLNWLDNDKSVLYVNYEEARAHWERVLFTQITQQNVYRGASLSALDRKHYTTLFKERVLGWGSNLMVKHDPDTPYYEDMEAWIRDIAYKGRTPDVIILDTIQSMFLKGSGKSLPRWGQYEEMMVRLEKLAKELHCVIIITAQENSNRMKEKREVVQQSDAGGSLTIVQKSSVTIFLTKAKLMTGDDSQDETIMQLQIPKNRITGTTFMMNPPLVRYNDDHKLYEKYDTVKASEYVSKEEFPEDGGFIG